MPIIGVNESGKTTILQAIFAFDSLNDGLNGRRHLRDTSNLYRTSSPPATIEAVIEMTRNELSDAISDCEEHYKTSENDHHFLELKNRRALPGIVTIRRDLKQLKYSFDSNRFGPPDIQDALAVSVIQYLPYILFFDDFRDKVEEKIEIIPQSKSPATEWLSNLEQLFKQTDRNFSVFNLPGLEDRQRKTVLAKVQRRLNETLTKEWQSFRLDDGDALKVSIEFHREVQELQLEPTTPSPAPIQAVTGLLSPSVPTSTTQRPVQKVVRNFVKLEVIETDSNGDEHFFFISDRSKGFYWFFNFVMKLEFNPKSIEGRQTIYLLDEPGSYLHAFAQRKLCEKLRRLSDVNCVIYCTHSHYLLDPETIPVSRIAIADKDGSGNVSLIPITSYRTSVSPQRSALEPVLDALEIRPFALDLISTRATVITEGIYDYFAMELFRDQRSVSILPSVGADSIKHYVSLLIAWQVDFRALWDNDVEGRAKYEQAGVLFGTEITARYFRLLPSKGAKRIMQDLFDGSDLVNVRTELELPRDSSFQQTLHSLFYSPRRTEIVQAMSPVTKQNFEDLFTSLSLSAKA